MLPNSRQLLTDRVELGNGSGRSVPQILQATTIGTLSAGVGSGWQ